MNASKCCRSRYDRRASLTHLRIRALAPGRGWTYRPRSTSKPWMFGFLAAPSFGHRSNPGGRLISLPFCPAGSTHTSEGRCGSVGGKSNMAAVWARRSSPVAMSVDSLPSRRLSATFLNPVSVSLINRNLKSLTCSILRDLFGMGGVWRMRQATSPMGWTAVGAITSLSPLVPLEISDLRCRRRSIIWRWTLSRSC